MNTPEWSERRAEAWSDGGWSRDDREPVYPDGTPKYECWNSNALRTPPKPVPKPEPRREEEDEA